MNLSKSLALILIALFVFYSQFLNPQKLKAQAPSGIALTKHVDKISAASGDILTYGVDWQNLSSTETYNNIKINDSVPQGTDYVAGSASSQGVFDGTQITWTINSAVPGAFGSVSFKVKINGPNPFGFAGLYTNSDGTRAQDLKVTFARKELWWHSVETSENTYDFTPLDNIYNSVNNYNLELMLDLRTQRGWGTDCTRDSSLSGTPLSTSSCPPKDISITFGAKGYSTLYYDYVYAILQHLFDTNRPIQYLVIENEVNTATFWYGNADDFLKTRTTAYKAAKDFRGNNLRASNLKVVDNGIADLVWGTAVTREKYCSNDINGAVSFAGRYLQRINSQPVTADYLAQNIHCPIQSTDFLARDYSILKKVFEKDPGLGGPSFDIMSYHFYAPWDTQEEVINWISLEMQKNGYQNPIVLTEGGYYDKLRYYTDDPSVAAKLKQDVANDVVKDHIIAFANKVKAWIWFPLEEKNSGTTLNSDYKGLYQQGGTPLPAQISYQLLVNKTKGFTAIKRLNLINPDIYVYEVSFGGRFIYIAWARNSEIIDLSHQISGNVRATNVDLSSNIVNSSSITINENPVYIESINP